METYKAINIDIGYHPDGFRIDKTASPMNLYTEWIVLQDGKWINPKPVCFHALPENGWHKAVSFNWNEFNRKIK